jgi:hypothetical protein
MGKAARCITRVHYNRGYGREWAEDIITGFGPGYGIQIQMNNSTWKTY